MSRTDEMLRLLRLSADYHDPNPGRSHITGQEHALRLAAYEWPDEEQRLVALVHDLARPLNDVHHGEMMAWMVADRVSPASFHLLLTHGEFQADAERARTDHADAPWVDRALVFAGRERATFHPLLAHGSLSVEDAESLIHRFLD